jgi:hypothetical protein
MTWVDPDVRDAPVPEIEVLIKEAHRRQRRRRGRAAGALFALVGLGFGAGFGFFGNGGNGGRGGQVRYGAAGGGGKGASSAMPSLSRARVIASTPFAPAGYQLSVDQGEIAVTAEAGWTDNSCRTRLLSPRTLRVVAVDRGCLSTSTRPAGVISDDRAAGDEVRVMTRNLVTGKPKLGPRLFTLDNWDWAHSGAVQGDGAYWIYELGPFGHRSSLIEVSTSTGTVIERFSVPAGPDPFMAVDADGFWITQSGYGGSSCARLCTLWHVAPGSSRLVAQRSLSTRTQWLIASGPSIYADVLTSAHHYGFVQSIWRVDGGGARVAYRTPARLLPSTVFGIDTGYVVTGNPREGFFTMTQLGRARTPDGVGACDSAAPIRLIRIDPATGAQRYVATLPRRDAGPALDCHLYGSQAVLDDGAFYVLTGQSDGVPAYTQVVRMPTRGA